MREINFITVEPIAPSPTADFVVINLVCDNAAPVQLLMQIKDFHRLQLTDFFANSYVSFKQEKIKTA